MKIQPQHYAHIRDAIRDKVDLVALHAAILDDGRYKDFGTRFRWDAYHAAIPSNWTCDNLYGYMNDTHIDTALRAIIKELS